MIHFKDNKTKSPLNTRWAQMTKQEQIIERKKVEIQAKLDAQKQAAALAAQAKLSNPTTKDDKNIFSNDGSFMSQFKALLEKQKEEKNVEENEREKNPEETNAEPNHEQEANETSDKHKPEFMNDNDGKHSVDKGAREKNRRWNDRGRNRPNSPMTPVIEDRKKPNENKNQSDIPSLMQIPMRHPEDNDSDQWRGGQSDSNSNQDSNDQFPGPNQMPPGPMPPGPMGPRMMGPGMMGPGGPGMMGPGGPGMMGPGGPGMMGPGGPGMMGPGGPGMMGPGGPGMMGPGGPGMMGPGGQGMMGPGGPGMMGPGGPGMMGPRGPGMMGPNGPGPNMPPFMGGPSNFPMPPNFMGPNGPRPMPPNMCGPNGPMPPFFGPPFPNPGMMGPNGPNQMGGQNNPPNCPPMMGPNGPPMMCGPNGPPNPMMRPPLMGGPNGPPGMMGANMPPNSMNNGSMPFMGPRPPFGGPPNFGNGNGPPNMPPFMPMTPNSMPPKMPDMKPGDSSSHSGLDMKQNIPMPLLNNMPPNDMKLGNNSTPKTSQDELPAPVRTAASEVATNGDHWENVLKHIHTQDRLMWFLHEPNSNEYKRFRELVHKLRNEKKPQIKDEDKYEPEFSLEDDEDSCDAKPSIKEENSNSREWSQPKREHTSSQSDDDGDSKKERRKRRKSRWGTEPPLQDIKPPGVMPPLPPLPPMPGMPAILGGPQLGKMDDGSLKLSNVNRNNQALMQYAMTNYGTTNLSPEDWKKCEDNFKLNLLYQDMLKKRQEVERLNAAGKHKYEYDSDEDTADGTWEHKLRAREMYATEKWADELTKQAAGKHHIGDFLPPEELKKFMEKYSAFKNGKEPDFSDYKEFKLKEDNVGFKMLQKLGWSEGQGLGADGEGIVDPINKANQPVANLGLGASSSDNVSPDDDEFDAYRKRMMLAYRFRPNPLNNPRRPYY